MTMDFTLLFDRWAEPFTLLERAPGHYAPNGIWQPGGEPVEVPMEGIIQPLSGADLRYDEAGTWSRDDRKLYVETPIDLGRQIKHRSAVYTVQSEVDQGTHGGFYLYYCRRERPTGEVTE